MAEPVAVVSFTFGLPPAAAVSALHDVGSEVWVTVTSAADAVAATTRGADTLVAQGLEAGGHRGGLADDLAGQLPLRDLVPAVRAVYVPACRRDRRDHGRLLGLRRPGPGRVRSGPGHRVPRLPGGRDDTRAPGGAAVRPPTALTRAFTGRTARGIRNRFMAEYADAPAAYPEVHFVTAPIRAAARAAGDGELVNLWAGTAYGLARSEPAADVVRRVGAPALADLPERQSCCAGASGASRCRSEPRPPAEPRGPLRARRLGGAVLRRRAGVERRSPTPSWSPRSPG